jgi:lactobin A/cerein 7B family class IIb bacteriocin
MTNSSNTRNDIELNDEELEEVTGGWGPGWSPGSALLPVSATSPAAAATLSAIQPIHLAPLPALHTAVPHL